MITPGTTSSQQSADGVRTRLLDEPPNMLGTMVISIRMVCVVLGVGLTLAANQGANEVLSWLMPLVIGTAVVSLGTGFLPRRWFVVTRRPHQVGQMLDAPADPPALR